MGAPRQEGRVPAQSPPHAEPTHLAGFAAPASSALLPQGLRVFLGSPHLEHHPLSPQGARRRSGNGFWLAPTEEFCFQGAVDGICCLLSPLRAVDSLSIGEGRGSWVGGEGAGLSPGTALPAHSFPQQISLWDTGGKTPQLEQIPSTTSQARLGGTTPGASVSLDEVQPGCTMGETGTGMARSPSQLVGATALLGARPGKIHLAARWIEQLHFR